MPTNAVDKVREQVGAVAASKNDAPTVFDLLERMKPAIEASLPAHLNGDRFARLATTLLRATPKLRECEATSFIGALMVSAQLGLEPGPPLGLSWIIPRRNNGRMEASWELGYKGVIELFRRSGQFKSIQAHEVCEGDEFDYAYGLDPFLKHKPSLKDDRGQAYAYYAVAQFSNGGNAFIVLSKADVEKRKSRGQGGPAWRTDYDAMARKTAVKALAPWLPLSPEIERALAAEGHTYTVVQPNMADSVPMLEAGGDADLDVPDEDIADAEVVDEGEFAKGEEPF